MKFRPIAFAPRWVRSGDSRALGLPALLALAVALAPVGCSEAPREHATPLTSGGCVRQPFTVKATLPPPGAVPAGTTLHYDFVVADADDGDCAQSFYSLGLGNTDPSLTAVFQPFGQQATAGQSLTFGLDVTSLADGDPGPHELVVRVQKTSLDVFETQLVRVTYDLTSPPGCVVSKRGELMITSTSVVDDPVRTLGNVDNVCSSSSAQRAGAFSFAHLVRQLAPRDEDAPALVERLLSLWLADQNVNGFVVRARPAMQERVLDLWPRTAAGALDLDRSPLRLQAIVNRTDLRDLARHSAGEGRFVFAFDSAAAFTLILEYDLPAQSAADVRSWAEAWHALSSHVFGSEAYRAALEKLTRRFTDRGASPTSPNGSALLRLRTNEVALTPPVDGRWELRQFELSAATGFFEEAPVAETPDRNLNGTPAFAAFVNENAAAILAAVPGSSPGLVPTVFQGSPFLGGSALNDVPVGVAWNAEGIGDPVLRFHASINTCNGCHGFDTQSVFLQITPRAPGLEAGLSPFLLGTTIFEPGGPFVLNDLARRKADLASVVCQPAGSGCR